MTIRPLLSVPLLILGLACSAPSPQDASTSTELPAAPSSPSAAAAQAPAVVSPHAPDPAAARAFQRLPEDAKKAYLAADLVVVARLEKPRIESILEVAPPIFVHAFDVVVDRRLGGSALPARLSAQWSTRDRGEPWVEAQGVQPHDLSAPDPGPTLLRLPVSGAMPRPSPSPKGHEAPMPGLGLPSILDQLRGQAPDLLKDAAR